MEYNGGDERIAFGTMAKYQKKYGSTSSRLRRNSSMLIHHVQRGDTLQGLAVRFGVTTEQIRRANNLWTNDSLFLRDKLLIPVASVDGEQEGGGNDRGECSRLSYLDRENSGHNANSSIHRFEEERSDDVVSNFSHPLCSDSYERCSWETDSETHFESESTAYVTDHPLAKNGESRFDANGGNIKDTSPRGGAVGSSNGTSLQRADSQSSTSKMMDFSEKSAMDFLSRIDNEIAFNRVRETKESDQNQQSWEIFDSDGDSDHRHTSGTSITTEGRHLRYSLKKLEKTQDELFQL